MAERPIRSWAQSDLDELEALNPLDLARLVLVYREALKGIVALELTRFDNGVDADWIARHALATDVKGKRGD